MFIVSPKPIRPGASENLRNLKNVDLVDRGDTKNDADE
jgi:hypothetical protein